MSNPRNSLHHDKIPTISIIMGAYNAEKTIRDSIESILAQDFTDWEFIICDDGSQDNTELICQEYSARYPDRFHIMRNDTNLKLAATLNRCLGVARGRFIARMDADDISSPDRFSKQLEALHSMPEIHLVGTSMQRFDSRGFAGLVIPPENPDRDSLQKNSPFCHATIMARREVFETLGGYSESKNAVRVEDIELWFRFFLNDFKGRNLKEPLYLVREDFSAVRRRTIKARWNGFLALCNGYRLLEYPLRSYIRPFTQLCKIFVPFRLQLWYRHWQKKVALSK